MATFLELKSRIETILDRDDITTEIDQAVKDAVDHYSVQNWWFKEAETSFSTVVDQEVYDFPTDVGITDYGGEIYSLRIEFNSVKEPLTRRPDHEIDALSMGTNSTGDPENYSVFDEKIRLDPIPNQVRTMHLKYLSDLTKLSDDSDTNAWTTDGYTLIRERALGDLRSNLLRDPTAVQQVESYAARGEDFFSGQERSAYNALKRRHRQRVSSGRLRGWLS